MFVVHTFSSSLIIHLIHFELNNYSLYFTLTLLYSIVLNLIFLRTMLGGRHIYAITGLNGMITQIYDKRTE